MIQTFQNKTIWITGASSGIGEALAYELSKQGALLLLSSRKKEQLEQVRQQCQHPEQVFIYPLDLEQHAAIPTIVDQVLAQHPRIDLLINNGGISQRSLTKETSLEVDKRLMAVNYLGTVALTKALLPTFLKQQTGHIVTVTSLTGVFATPYRSTYAASKHALHGFFDALRAETVQDNLKVTLVCPGFVKTKISFNALTGNGQAQNSMDQGQANGMDAQVFAKKMLRAIAKEKKEVYIGGRETIGVYIKRYLPWLYYKIIPNTKVK